METKDRSLSLHVARMKTKEGNQIANEQEMKALKMVEGGELGNDKQVERSWGFFFQCEKYLADKSISNKTGFSLTQE